MNRVILTGTLPRDPEIRTLASGKTVTQFPVVTRDYPALDGGREVEETHYVVAWDRLGQIVAQYVGRGALVTVEGGLRTRSWDDDKGRRFWKTEVVASSVELLRGPRGGAGRGTLNPDKEADA